MIVRVANAYSQLKNDIGEMSGSQENLLHIHLGLIIFVLAALLMRRKMRSPLPLAIVAVFALMNEIVDFLSEWPSSLSHSIVDVANTLFWPLVLFLIARRGRPAEGIESKAGTSDRRLAKAEDS
jgi:hypothetical protein